MKQKKIIGLVMSCFLFCGGIIGCNKPNVTGSNNDDLIYYSLTIDGDKVEIPKDNEEIVKIEEVSKKYIVAATQSDYTKEYDYEEYTYYTKDLQEMYEEYGVPQSTDDYIQENQLLAKVSDLTIKSEELYTINRVEHSTVVVDFITVTEHAIDEYFEDRGIEKGIRYRRTATVKLIKEDDEWKILELTNISEREKVE